MPAVDLFVCPDRIFGRYAFELPAKWAVDGVSGAVAECISLRESAGTENSFPRPVDCFVRGGERSLFVPALQSCGRQEPKHLDFGEQDLYPASAAGSDDACRRLSGWDTAAYGAGS